MNFRQGLTRRRLYYFYISVVVIILGLLSRSSMITPWLPLSVGDLLYATLAYFLTSIILPAQTKFTRAVLAVLWCISVEVSQLADWGLLKYARQTLPGRLILGQGFLWSDFIFYGAGVISAIIVDIRMPSWIKAGFLENEGPVK